MLGQLLVTMGRVPSPRSTTSRWPSSPSPGAGALPEAPKRSLFFTPSARSAPGRTLSELHQMNPGPAQAGGREAGLAAGRLAGLEPFVRMLRELGRAVQP